MFYGWRIVAVAFLAHCVTTGIVFYSFGVFLQALGGHFGWSRAETSFGFSLVALAGAAYSPLVGRAIDRFGPRPVQIFGACAMSLGFLLLSRIDSLAEFYLLMGLAVALGSTAMGQLPSNAAVARWFVRRRGTALGVATAGISMGGVVFVPLTQFLINSFGWRTAFAVLGALVVALVVPPVAAFMRGSPEEMGMRPDGEPPSPGGASLDLAEELERSWTPEEAIRHPNFWRIGLAFALAMMSIVATLLHLISFFGDRGVPPGRASWVLGATAGMGVLGKLGFGALQQRLGERGAILLCFALQAAGIALILLATGPVARVVFVVVYGFAMGGTAISRPP